MYSRFARGLLCAALIFVCGFAFARGRCDCTISQFTDLEDLRDMMVKIAVYGQPGESDLRKTEQELAAATGEKVADIHARYSATGTISCPATDGSAQVTFRNNVITTSDHIFWDPDTCVKKANPSQCTLILKSLSGSEQKIKLKDYADGDHGFKCPTKPGDGDDWAVVKLDGVAQGVQPYAVPELTAKALEKGTAVTLVAHSIDFLRKDRSGKVEAPKHIQRNCHINELQYSVWDKSVLTRYKGDCDESGFASGGSILVEGSHGPILAAIVIAGAETKAQANQTWEKDKDGYPTGKVTPNIHPWNSSTWSGYYTPVAGNFLKAIRSAQ